MMLAAEEDTTKELLFGHPVPQLMVSFVNVYSASGNIECREATGNFVFYSYSDQLEAGSCVW